jgi:hypothetical protein
MPMRGLGRLWGALAIACSATAAWGFHHPPPLSTPRPLAPHQSTLEGVRRGHWRPQPLFSTPTAARQTRLYSEAGASAGAPGGAKKKVVVIGAGWAGLGAAWELAKRGDVEVTLLEAGTSVGGLVRPRRGGDWGIRGMACTRGVSRAGAAGGSC